MNIQNENLKLLDTDTFIISENFKIDISNFGASVELYSFQKKQLSSLISNNVANYYLYSENNSPKYVLKLVLGEFLIKKISNINSNSLLLYLKRYNIKLNNQLNLHV